MQGHVKMSAAAFSLERDKVGGQERGPVAAFHKGRLHADRTRRSHNIKESVASLM